MRLKVKRISDKAILPTRAYNLDAGYDLYSIEKVSLCPGETRAIHTGCKIQLELDPNDFNTYVLLIMERSSLGKQGIARRAGVIDQGYTNEVIVLLTNHNERAYHIGIGDKIAQLIIQKVETPHVEEVLELNETERGNSGFGSSGK